MGARSTECSIEKLQQQWDHTTKGLATKEFFPKIKDRLKTKINLTHNFAAMITTHGKTRSYLHRFNIIESPECPCLNGNQSVGHLLYQCSKLNNEREELISYISKEDNWPVKKNELVNKYLKVYQFYKLHWLRKNENEQSEHKQCINSKQIRQKCKYCICIIKHAPLQNVMEHAANKKKKVWPNSKSLFDHWFVIFRVTAQVIMVISKIKT